MKHRKSVLSAAIVTCLGFAVQVQAQEAAPAGASATELDTVIVVGIRGSLKQALDAKRDADNIVDVVTAEDVGKFPATNVAEAITIIPGVTIDKAFGQGEKVSILGTDPALNRTLLNGQTVASADWFITDQPGRTFNYSLLAPQIVGRVDVYKSPEAHVDEGSIGGTVNIVTRKPLDLSKTTVSGQIGYLYNDRIGSGDPQASLLLGWKNDADNFGVIVAAQRAQESIRRDGIESYGTVTGRDYAYGQVGQCDSNVVRYYTITMSDVQSGSNYQDLYVSEASSKLDVPGCVTNTLTTLNDYDTSGYFNKGFIANHFGSVRSDAGLNLILGYLAQ